MVKLVDTLDLKSSEQQCSCGFKSRSEYKKPFFGRVFLFIYTAIVTFAIFKAELYSKKHSNESKF